MAMISFPFDSKLVSDIGGSTYDRAIDSKTYRKLLQEFFMNGVFPNPSSCFQVVQNSTLGAKVMPGKCLINGAFGSNDEETTIRFDTADAQARIDRVVLRLDDNIDERNISIKVIKGIPAESPTPSSITRTASIYDLILADVKIEAGLSVVTNLQITDKRGFNELCGYVSGTIKEVDTSTIFNQYQSALDQYLELVQNALDGTLAGQIQNEINAIKNKLGAKVSVGFDDNPVLEEGEVYIVLDRNAGV